MGARCSSREVGLSPVPFFSVVYFSRGALPQERVKGHDTGGPRRDVRGEKPGKFQGNPTKNQRLQSSAFGLFLHPRERNATPCCLHKAKLMLPQGVATQSLNGSQTTCNRFTSPSPANVRSARHADGVGSLGRALGDLGEAGLKGDLHHFPCG